MSDHLGQDVTSIAALHDGQWYMGNVRSLGRGVLSVTCGSASRSTASYNLPVRDAVFAAFRACLEELGPENLPPAIVRKPYKFLKKRK